MEEWLGRGWRAVIHPEDLDRAAKKWQAALATGEPVTAKSERELRPASIARA
jgi:hypothetical protein